MVVLNIENMRTHIVMRGGHSGARPLIEKALLRLPEYVSAVMPDIRIEIVPFESLPRSTRHMWGQGAIRPGIGNNDWAIRNITDRWGPYTIRVFLLEESGGEDDYLFQRDIISAVLECGFIKQNIAGAVRTAMEKHPRCRKYQARSLFVRELARLIMNPTAMEDEEPELLSLFRDLEHEMRNMALPIHTS